MSSSNKPLSSLSLNLVHQKKVKSRKRVEKNAIASGTPPRIRQPYIRHAPEVEHVGQLVLPFPNSEMTELKICELFWDWEVVSVVVEGTNTYAEAKQAGKPTPGGVQYRRPWKKVTDADMIVFFALLIYMGAKRGSGSNSFWKEEGENRADFRAMNLKRFSQIK